MRGKWPGPPRLDPKRGGIAWFFDFLDKPPFTVDVVTYPEKPNADECEWLRRVGRQFVGKSDTCEYCANDVRPDQPCRGCGKIYKEQIGFLAETNPRKFSELRCGLVRA